MQEVYQQQVSCQFSLYFILFELLWFALICFYAAGEFFGVGMCAKDASDVLSESVLRESRISLRIATSGLSSGAGAGFSACYFFVADSSLLINFTTRKITKAVMMKLITACIKSPYFI
jgi:hypothetical protein